MRLNAVLSLGAVIVLGLASTNLAAAVAIPDSRVGNVLQRFLDAFNSGEQSQLEAFAAKYGGPDWLSKVEGLAKMQGPSGGVDVTYIGKQGANFIEWVEQTRKDKKQYMGMMEIEEGEPARLARFRYAVLEEGSRPGSFFIDAATRSEIVEKSAVKLNEIYVFPKVALEMVKVIKGKLRSGRYDLLTTGDEFSNALTEDLRSVSHDKHIGVTFSPVIESRVSSTPADLREAHRAEFLQDNCGFRKVEIMPDNIGYLKFDYFPDPQVCGETAINAMQFVAHADALVFDLRENGGGDPAMVALVSTYLFPESTHLSDIWIRKTDETQQFWTLPYVPGIRMPTIPTYVLTSSDTFSGAEEFANNLKTLKRATIVGEITGGGAHPVETYLVGDRFTVWVPFGRSVNPITHTNWEGHGVEPDVALKADAALEKALALAKEKISERTNAEK